jgi:hypothetical protein
MDTIKKDYKNYPIIEILLVKTRKDDSKNKIKNKEELLHTLTGKETFDTGTRYYIFGI